jgi:hypothetical protein
MLDALLNFLIGVPPGVDLALWPLLIPLISAGVSAAGSYLGRSKTSDQQKANLDAQSRYMDYEMSRKKRLDPMHEALIRMASGMLPDYAQSRYGFDQWGGMGQGRFAQQPSPNHPAAPRKPREF